MKKLNIIALLGKAGSGKDTAGQMLLELADGRGFQTAFADKLKSIAGEMFGLSQEDMYTDEGKKRETEFDCLMCPTCQKLECQQITVDGAKLGECKLCGSIGALKVFKAKWTVRTILQHLGTEGFRRINPMVWISYTLKVAERELETHDFVVITDCRFPKSEAKGVWAVGGEVWRIKRRLADEKATGIAGHASETEMDELPDSECQAIIDNNGTLDELRAQLHVQLERFLAARLGREAA